MPTFVTERRAAIRNHCAPGLQEAGRNFLLAIGTIEKGIPGSAARAYLAKERLTNGDGRGVNLTLKTCDAKTFREPFRKHEFSVASI